MSKPAPSGPVVLISKQQKIACNTCAAGKRRCDGALPVCGRCLTLRKQCLWPAAVVPVQQAQHHISGLSSTLIPVGSTTAASHLRAVAALPSAFPAHHANSSSGGFGPADADDASSETSLPDGPADICILLPPVLLPWHRLSLAPLAAASLPLNTERPRPHVTSSVAGQAAEETGGNSSAWDAATVPESSSVEGDEEDADRGSHMEDEALGEEEGEGGTHGTSNMNGARKSVVALADAARLLWALAGGLRVPRGWLLSLQREAEDKRVAGLQHMQAKDEPAHVHDAHVQAQQVQSGASEPSMSMPRPTTAWDVLSGPEWDGADPESVLRIVLASSVPAWLVVYGACKDVNAGAAPAQSGSLEAVGGGDGGGRLVRRERQIEEQAATHLVCNTAALRLFGWTGVEVMQRCRAHIPMRWMLPTHTSLSARCLAEVQARLSGERLLHCTYKGRGENDVDVDGEVGVEPGSEGKVVNLDGFLLTRRLVIQHTGLVNEYDSIASYVDAALLPAINPVRQYSSQFGGGAEEGGCTDLCAVLESIDDAAVYTPCRGVEHVVGWYKDPFMVQEVEGGVGGITPPALASTHGDMPAERQTRRPVRIRKPKLWGEGADEGGSRRRDIEDEAEVGREEEEVVDDQWQVVPALRMQAVFFSCVKAESVLPGPAVRDPLPSSNFPLPIHALSLTSQDVDAAERGLFDWSARSMTGGMGMRAVYGEGSDDEVDEEELAREEAEAEASAVATAPLAPFKRPSTLMRPPTASHPVVQAPGVRFQAPKKTSGVSSRLHSDKMGEEGEEAVWPEYEAGQDDAMDDELVHEGFQVGISDATGTHAFHGPDLALHLQGAESALEARHGQKRERGISESQSLAEAQELMALLGGTTAGGGQGLTDKRRRGGGGMTGREEGGAGGDIGVWDSLPSGAHVSGTTMPPALGPGAHKGGTRAAIGSGLHNTRANTHMHAVLRPTLTEAMGYGAQYPYPPSSAVSLGQPSGPSHALQPEVEETVALLMMSGSVTSDMVHSRSNWPASRLAVM